MGNNPALHLGPLGDQVELVHVAEVGDDDDGLSVFKQVADVLPSGPDEHVTVNAPGELAKLDQERTDGLLGGVVLGEDVHVESKALERDAQRGLEHVGELHAHRLQMGQLFGQGVGKRVLAGPGIARDEDDAFDAHG